MVTEIQALRGLFRARLGSQPRDVLHKSLIKIKIISQNIIESYVRVQTENPSLIEINPVLPFWVYYSDSVCNHIVTYIADSRCP